MLSADACLVYAGHCTPPGATCENAARAGTRDRPPPSQARHGAAAMPTVKPACGIGDGAAERGADGSAAGLAASAARSKEATSPSGFPRAVRRVEAPGSRPVNEHMGQGILNLSSSCHCTVAAGTESNKENFLCDMEVGEKLKNIRKTWQG